MKSKLWRELKPFIWPLVVVIVYAVVRAVFASVAGDRGVLTPSGGVDNGLALLAIATVVLRMFVLIVIPMIVVYRLVWRVAEAIQNRAR